jgi:hypothetical protein
MRSRLQAKTSREIEEVRDKAVGRLRKVKAEWVQLLEKAET